MAFRFDRIKCFQYLLNLLELILIHIFNEMLILALKNGINEIWERCCVISDNWRFITCLEFVLILWDFEEWQVSWSYVFWDRIGSDIDELLLRRLGRTLGKCGRFSFLVEMVESRCHAVALVDFYNLMVLIRYSWSDLEVLRLIRLRHWSLPLQPWYSNRSLIVRLFRWKHIMLCFITSILDAVV